MASIQAVKVSKENTALYEDVVSGKFQFGNIMKYI